MGILSIDSRNRAIRMLQAGVKVNVLGYSLHPVILLRSVGLFICDSISTPQGAYSLVAHWHRTDQLTMPSLPSLYHFFYLFVWRGSGNRLAQGPQYDRFSQDSNPWSSDHRYGALTNSAIVVVKQKKDVTVQFNVHKCRATRLARWYWATNSVADQPRSGLPRKTNQRTDWWMVNKVLRNHKILATKIQAELQAVSASHNISTIEWPRKSPYVSPIENLWFRLWVQVRSRNNPPQTIQQIVLILYWQRSGLSSPSITSQHYPIPWEGWC